MGSVRPPLVSGVGTKRLGKGRVKVQNKRKIVTAVKTGPGQLPTMQVKKETFTFL